MGWRKYARAGLERGYNVKFSVRFVMEQPDTLSAFGIVYAMLEDQSIHPEQVHITQADS